MSIDRKIAWIWGSHEWFMGHKPFAHEIVYFSV